MKKISTSLKNGCFIEEQLAFYKDEIIENNLVNIYPQKTYQTFLGFGGAFTESAGYALSFLDEQKRNEAISAYFGDEGIGYNFCRTHIHSCDFSLNNYTYIEEMDTELKTFDIKRDKDYLIPFIKDAQKLSSKGFQLLASPWSPPAFMKTNGVMNGGGKLKPEYRQLWAEYLVKYILTYKELGIDINVISAQNEPMAVQTWDSCVYTTEEEYDFAINYLKPELDKKGLDVKIILWDHNKERLYEKAMAYLESEDVWGMGFHWYSGDHFETLQMTYEDYPDKNLIFSEGCVEYSKFEGKGEVFIAETYAHDILGNLNHGMSAFIDWNMFLDEVGGPNHVNNFCAAPIICDSNKKDFEKHLAYYYIGHFSKYIDKGAKRIGYSKFTDKLEVTAFQNVDGEKVVVILNRGEEDISFNIRENDSICKVVAKSHSINTLIYNTI